MHGVYANWSAFSGIIKRFQNGLINEFVRKILLSKRKKKAGISRRCPEFNAIYTFLVPSIQITH